MTTGAAILAVWIALLLGWYGAHFWIAEHDEISARNRHNNAVRTMWRYRRLLLVVGVIGVILADLWFRGAGR